MTPNFQTIVANDCTANVVLLSLPELTQLKRQMGVRWLKLGYQKMLPPMDYPNWIMESHCYGGGSRRRPPLLHPLLRCRRRGELEDGEDLSEPDDVKKMSFVCRISSANTSLPAPSPRCFLRYALHLYTMRGQTRRSSKPGSMSPAASSATPNPSGLLLLDGVAGRRNEA
jgi:hypothetical protein